MVEPSTVPSGGEDGGGGGGGGGAGGCLGWSSRYQSQLTATMAALHSVSDPRHAGTVIVQAGDEVERWAESPGGRTASMMLARQG